MRSSTLNSQDAVIRRVLYWTALLAGVGLVSLQFGCDRPQATPFATGFPHASRWPVRQPESRAARSSPSGSNTESLQEGVTAESKLYIPWIQPQRSETQSALAVLQKDAVVQQIGRAHV